MSGKMAGIGGHHRGHRGVTCEWLTPPEILRPLGAFDLDPCTAIEMPWATAAKMWNVNDDGLMREWFGRVWLNPPYGPETATWLERLAMHGNGIALIFARTETRFFHRWGWERADGMLFLRGRLNFYTVDGKRSNANAGGPSVLIAYGLTNAATLKTCGIAGHYVDITR